MIIPCEVLSPGVAEGQLTLLSISCERPGAECPRLADPEAESVRFGQQVAALADDLERIISHLESESLTAEADIIRMHIMLLHDRKFQGRIEELIRQGGVPAHNAVAHVAEEMLKLFESIQDPYLAERSADIKDLALQLESRLLNGDPQILADRLGQVADPVLAIPELLPSIVLQARTRGVRALVVEKGTGFSHAAILARAFGLPAVRVPDLDPLQSRQGIAVLVDGNRGELLVAPSRQERQSHLELAAPAIYSRSRTMAARLWVSIVDPRQLDEFDWRQVQGVGLYRTETMFMLSQRDFPSEDEQVSVYRRLFELCGDRPATVRTLDLGGDKIVPYLSISHEDNPYLGLRAHRLYRFHPDLLITQVRAILRAAHGPHRLRLMFPMIESLDQWRFVQDLVRQAMGSMHAEGLAFQEHFEQGVLVETPSAVWDFDRLLEHADFAGVGTNDLVQYLFAVERNNANVAELYQPEHPIVLRVLRRLVRQARTVGKSLTICGEIARNLAMLPLLIGLGLRDLTVGVRSVEAVAGRLSSLSLEDCRRVARACLQADSVAQVRTYLGGAPDQSNQSATHGQAVDPICRMVVRKHGNPFSVVCQEVTYYFCSSRCMSRFVGDTCSAAQPSRQER